jgi:hypothetical protein
MTNRSIIEGMYALTCQALSQNYAPKRFIIGRTTWAVLRRSAGYDGPREPPDNLKVWGLPTTVDDGCGPGYGLVAG